jgi:hypothetical protein
MPTSPNYLQVVEKENHGGEASVTDFMGEPASRYTPALFVYFKIILTVKSILAGNSSLP